MNMAARVKQPYTTTLVTSSHLYNEHTSSLKNGIIQLIEWSCSRKHTLRMTSSFCQRLQMLMYVFVMLLSYFVHTF